MRAKYNAEIGKKEQLELLVAQKKAESVVISKRAEDLELTKMLLSKTAEEAREAARVKLEQIVTHALQYVFGPDFRFVIEMKESRGKADASFYVESVQGSEIVRTDPLLARGGGVVDIIAIALQLAVVQIHNNPRIQGPIFLDEPGKHVDAENAVKLAMFVKEMSKQLNRQINMVTHQPHLAEIATQSYNVELKGGRSIVDIQQPGSQSRPAGKLIENTGQDEDGHAVIGGPAVSES